MGNRFATIDMGRKEEGDVPLSWERGGELGPHLTQCDVRRTKWHLDPSSRLTTTDMGRKLGLCPF